MPAHLKSGLCGGIVLEDGAAADIAAHLLEAFVSGVLHDGPLAGAMFGGRRRQARAQAVSGIESGITARGGDGGLHRPRHPIARERLVENTSRIRVESPKDPALLYAGSGEPVTEGPDWAGLALPSIGKADFPALAFRIGFGAPQLHQHAGVGEREIFYAEPDQFRTSESTGKAHQQQGAVAASAQALRKCEERSPEKRNRECLFGFGRESVDAANAGEHLPDEKFLSGRRETEPPDGLG